MVWGAGFSEVYILRLVTGSLAEALASGLKLGSNSLKSPPAAGWLPPVPCEAPPCLLKHLAQESYGERFCSWQPLASRDGQCWASKVCELTAARDMKCWERAKELPALTDKLSSLP